MSAQADLANGEVTTRSYVLCVNANFSFEDFTTGVGIPFCTLPIGARVLGGFFEILVAWYSGTSDTFEVGDAVDPNEYISAQDGQVVSFSATITNRSYSPPQINVPFGATVEITVKNNDNEQHGLFLQDFGVQEVVGPRQTKTIRFVANRIGESATFCSVVHPEKLIINVQ